MHHDSPSQTHPKSTIVTKFVPAHECWELVHKKVAQEGEKEGKKERKWRREKERKEESLKDIELTRKRKIEEEKGRKRE